MGRKLLKDLSRDDSVLAELKYDESWDKSCDVVESCDSFMRLGRANRGEDGNDNDNDENDEDDSISVSFCVYDRSTHDEQKERPAFFIPDFSSRSSGSGDNRKQSKSTSTPASTSVHVGISQSNFKLRTPPKMKVDEAFNKQVSLSLEDMHIGACTRRNITNVPLIIPSSSLLLGTDTNNPDTSPKQQDRCHRRSPIKVICQSRRPTLKTSNESLSTDTSAFLLEARKSTDNTCISRDPKKSEFPSARHNRTLWRRVAFVAKKTSRPNSTDNLNKITSVATNTVDMMNKNEDDAVLLDETNEREEDKKPSLPIKTKNSSNNEERHHDEDQDFVLRLQREIQENHTHDVGLRTWFLDCLDNNDDGGGRGGIGDCSSRSIARATSQDNHWAHRRVHQADHDEYCYEPPIPRRVSSGHSNTLFSIDEHSDKFDESKEHLDNHDGNSSSFQPFTFLRRTVSHGLGGHLSDLLSIIPTKNVESQNCEIRRHSNGARYEENRSSDNGGGGGGGGGGDYHCGLYGVHSSSSSKSLSLSGTMNDCKVVNKGSNNTRVLPKPRGVPSSAGWTGSLAYMATYRS